MQLRQFIHCAGIAAAVACFNAPLNASAAVESPIVGYQTITLTKRYTLVAFNFSPLLDVKNPDASASINNLITGDFATGDQIQVQTLGGYALAIWDAVGKRWCNKKGLGGSVPDTATPSPIKLERGKGFWIVAEKASQMPVNVTVAGEILQAPTTINCAKRYVIAAPTLPKDYPINTNEISWTNLTTGDQIQVQTLGGYTLAIWDAVGKRWCNKKGLGGSVPDTTTPSPMTIKQGQAFWIVSTSDTATCTFTNTL